MMQEVFFMLNYGDWLWTLWTKSCKQGELVYQKGLINFCVL